MVDFELDDVVVADVDLNVISVDLDVVVVVDFDLNVVVSVDLDFLVFCC